MDIASKFRDVRVLVAGDVMLDRFWWGDVTRISPEAPVPIVSLSRTSLAAGGAANVAANVAGLGAKAMLLGCVGMDSEAEELCSVISKHGIVYDNLIRSAQRTTTVKTRVIAHSQQVARIDQETIEPLSEADQEKVLAAFARSIEEVDVVAVSDYAKGFFSKHLLDKIIDTACLRNVPIVVDPKGRDYTRYKGASVLTPNRREAALACNLEENGEMVVTAAGERLCGELDVEAVLITEGEDGMTLFENGLPPFHFAASAREVYDVTGAGDTVIAAIAVALGAGLAMREATRIANVAAGLVVERVGTAVVDLNDVEAFLATSEH